MLVPILLPVSLKRGAEVVRSHNAGGGVLRGPGLRDQGQRVPAGGEGSKQGSGDTGTEEYVEECPSRDAAALRRVAGEASWQRPGWTVAGNTVQGWTVFEIPSTPAPR